MTSISATTFAALTATVLLAAAVPSHAYGRYDTREHPASQGWRWSARNHTWYRQSYNRNSYVPGGHRNYGESDDWKYSKRNHTWYYRHDRDDTADHPASQGWRWSNHDRMWYRK